MYTILIVDDEKIERNGMKFLLKREAEEFQILEASNGREALGILEKQKADILLTDIKMPYMSGLELANVKGYAEELERFDVKLGELLDELREDDLLIITADHGNDPTHTGTDHTREKVPFFAYSPSMEGYGKLEDQNTFAVIGATIADNFEVKMPEGTIGSSLLDELK